MKNVFTHRVALTAHKTVIIALLGFVVWLLMVAGLHLLPVQAGPGPRGMDPEKQLTHLKDRLQLDDRQVEEIRPILEDSAARREEIRARCRSQGQPGMAGAREEMHALRQETETSLGEVLTTEQMETFRAFRTEQRQRMRKRKQP